MEWRFTSALISSVPLLYFFSCSFFFFLFHNILSTPFYCALPFSHCSRLLPEPVEGPDSDPTGWWCLDWMQAQDVSTRHNFLEEREGSLEGEPQVCLFFIWSNKHSVCRTGLQNGGSTCYFLFPFLMFTVTIAILWHTTIWISTQSELQPFPSAV